MPRLYCGLDFGTTNSSIALSDGNKVSVLDVDRHNDIPASLPSLLYISRKAEHIVGRAAANAFIGRNVDREVLLEQVDLGVSIDAYVASEPDKSESYRPAVDQPIAAEAVRAHATVEINSPGRLFQSLKSQLRHGSFRGTEVFGETYLIEALVATILRRLKEAADETADEEIETVVIGRPVRFSRSPEGDALAARRLRTAAGLAGFKGVTFFYEPVAACVEYAIAGNTKERLMVVDIGGGTCDVCVMEFGGARGTVERLAESRILGVAGVPVAGDEIDREIMRQKLFPHFGSRSRYGPSNLPAPQSLFNRLLDWQTLYMLNTEETINWLIAMGAYSTQPEAIRALRYVIQRNYGYPLVRAVESAKKRLSFDDEATIAIHKDVVNIDERLERSEFARIIEHTLDMMMASIQEAESGAGVRPEQIDRVLTTGGTSLIPAIRRMLEQRFGPDKITQRDTFTSVAAGLATVAPYV